MNTTPSSVFSPDYRSLILLWAFAESGIGGFLHAFKLPFTGIFVGSIAVVCISLIGYYQFERKNAILEALGIVLLVKLAISPHSPWQAYVAVIFQGYLGYWLFKSNTHFKIRVFVFALLCLLESSAQKVLIASFVFGKNFLTSIDDAVISIMHSVGYQADISAVGLVFGSYIALHIITGLILGTWIPKIPGQLQSLHTKMPDFLQNELQYIKNNNKKYKIWTISLLVFIMALVVLKWILPDMKALTLIYIFVRTIAVSLVLIFLIGPLVKRAILAYWTKNKMDTQMVNDIISQIPSFSKTAYGWMHYVNDKYSGIEKVRVFILGLLVISGQYKE